MMRLWINGTSPYARLCRVVAAEKGIELSLQWTDPWSEPAALLAVAPAAKIPALELDDGIALVESSVICDVLDRMGTGKSLAPKTNRAAARLGLARALTDCAFAAVVQRRFHPGEEPPLAARWQAAIERSLATLEAHQAMDAVPVPAPAPADTLDLATPDLADLTLGVALSYLKLRHPGSVPGPSLTAFRDAMDARPSFVSTDWTT